MSLDFAARAHQHSDLTLVDDIELLNCQQVDAGFVIGWSYHPLSEVLTIECENNLMRLEDYFQQGDDHSIAMKLPCYVYMATRHTSIAASDCLFYLVPVDPAANRSAIEKTNENIVNIR
jgi:hypothetical protein